ncbi:hypothetical protein TEA_019029 [Camellia sinensis var. sinensis]|uniref:Uncharacterized protein n=1 Tax=Camellia sinensis var. sinensis TaxID=542762 RepID=A0A4S4ERZ3_CAMSN|nr:hypothetical protein TEA_019029 [Camellia sinensis var. sinensis]
MNHVCLESSHRTGWYSSLGSHRTSSLGKRKGEGVRAVGQWLWEGVAVVLERDCSGLLVWRKGCRGSSRWRGEVVLVRRVSREVAVVIGRNGSKLESTTSGIEAESTVNYALLFYCNIVLLLVWLDKMAASLVVASAIELLCCATAGLASAMFCTTLICWSNGEILVGCCWAEAGCKSWFEIWLQVLGWAASILRLDISLNKAQFDGNRLGPDNAKVSSVEEVNPIEEGEASNSIDDESSPTAAMASSSSLSINNALQKQNRIRQKAEATVQLGKTLGLVMNVNETEAEAMKRNGCCFIGDALLGLLLIHFAWIAIDGCCFIGDAFYLRSKGGSAGLQSCTDVACVNKALILKIDEFIPVPPLCSTMVTRRTGRDRAATEVEGMSYSTEVKRWCETATPASRTVAAALRRQRGKVRE